MSLINEETILKLIKDIKFSNNQKIIACISKIIIQNNNIGFSINVAGISDKESIDVHQHLTLLLKKIDNIGKVSIILTKNLESSNKLAQAKIKYTTNGVKKVILIVAGKGGVGKSTITAALAQQLAQVGMKIGIIDADIYGPSIPNIFGIMKKPLIHNNQFIPLEVNNIQIMSIGFLIKNNDALAWRGPMVTKVLQQLFNSNWDNLDYLFIDSPPGTGDIHLSLCENYNISGAIIVTTPQKLSYLDASKAAKLLDVFNIPILGIIENMNHYKENNNSYSSGQNLAKELNVPLICTLAYDYEIGNHCDEGKSLNNIIKIPLEFIEKIK